MSDHRDLELEETLGVRVFGYALIALIVVLIILAVATLWPHAAAKPNVLGYRSYCPNAPYSTLMLLGLAFGARQMRRLVLDDRNEDD